MYTALHLLIRDLVATHRAGLSPHISLSTVGFFGEGVLMSPWN